MTERHRRQNVSKKETYQRKNLTFEGRKRIIFIHDLLKTGNIYSRSQICSLMKDAMNGLDIDTAERTISRDIQFMRNEFHAPLPARCTRKGIYYEEDRREEYELPLELLREDEYAETFVACSLMARQLDINDPFNQLVLDILKSKHDSFSERFKQILSNITEKNSRIIPLHSVDINVLRTAISALTEEKKLEFDYRKANGEISHCIVSPYKFILEQEELYIRAFCDKKECKNSDDKDISSNSGIRTYALSRISECNIIDEPRTLEKAKDTSCGAWGAYRDDKGKIVQGPCLIQFSETASPYIKETWGGPEDPTSVHGEYFPSPEGGCILKLNCPPSEDIVGLILKWGKNAKALKPKILVDKVKEHIKALAESYEI